MTDTMEVDSMASPMTNISGGKNTSKEKVKTTCFKVAGIEIETNKSRPISTNPDMCEGDEQNQPHTTKTRIKTGGINLDVNSIKKGNTKKVHSVFNIKGAKIKNASIGNTGPVTFNDHEEKYEAGAVNDSVNIEGGNFDHANIGGCSHSNNQESNINGNSDGLSAETLVKNVLETNISAEDLIALIDKKFTIQQMSTALPALCPPANISQLAKALIKC